MENTKLSSIQQKIFAGNTTTEDKQITVFGSRAQTGTMVFSTDPAAIQNDNWSNGWKKATVVGKAPLQQDFNAIEYVNSYNIAYLQQRGIGEYNEKITYFKGSIVSILNMEDKPLLYFSKVDNNIGNNPLTDMNNWEQLKFGGSGASLPLLTPLFFDYILNDQSWVRSDLYSWLDGSVYSNAYDHLISDINGKETTTETITLSNNESVEITYYLADDGHKVVDVTDDTSGELINAIETLYNGTGIAWCYIIDTTNTQFKLPRSKWAFVGYRNSIGGYVQPELPNITGTFGAIVASMATASGAFTKTSQNAATGSVATGNAFDFKASNSNTIYKDGATVQPPATEMYLYFYVGEFTQTATQQTAGLNAELFNNKVDLDLANINTTGKQTISNISHFDYSSTSRVNLTSIFNTQGNNWVATDDGIIHFYYNQYAGGTMLNVNGQIVARSGDAGGSYGRYFYYCLTAIVSKGDVVSIPYYSGNVQDNSCYFYPNKK